MEKIVQIFKEEPYQWGFRGDPYLWKELESRLLEIKPITEKNFARILDATFDEFIEKEGTKKTGKSVIISSFPKSGMSGGVVSLEWWYDMGLPLLKKRFAEL